MDMTGITDALTIAKEGLGAIKEAGGIAGKLRDLFRTDKDAVPPIEVVNLASDLAQKLLNAQFAQSEIMNRLLELERTLKEADRREQEAARYELATLPMGGLVLALKPGDPKGEPPHYLCQRCATDGKHYVLQPLGRSDATKECPGCKQTFRLRPPDRGGPVTDAYDFDPRL